MMQHNICKSSPVHTNALKEFLDITTNGNAHQLTAMYCAFSDALNACLSKDAGSLKTRTTNSKGSLYLAKYKFNTLLNVNPTVAHTIVGIYWDNNNNCMNILACDVSSSRWWHEPPDQDTRALNRIP
nr:hypothetical protein [uncultured Halomonas sp.]